jgi:pimeloyl-ACP methyl ester carboxylesterase
MNGDTLEILALPHRYLLSIDAHDDAQFADNFQRDGVDVSPFGTAVGRDQILATIHQWHAGRITAGRRPMIGPWRIDVNARSCSILNSRISAAPSCPGTITSSMRIYYEGAHDPAVWGPPTVKVPGERPLAALAVWPGDIAVPPREWAERTGPLARYTVMPRGGHLAEWEEPELVAEELRTVFRARH